MSMNLRSNSSIRLRKNSGVSMILVGLQKSKHHELVRITITLRTPPVGRDIGKWRARCNLPQRISLRWVVNPPANLAFEACVRRESRAIAEITAFETLATVVVAHFQPAPPQSSLSHPFQYLLQSVHGLVQILWCCQDHFRHIRHFNRIQDDRILRVVIHHAPGIGNTTVGDATNSVPAISCFIGFSWS